ncbi:MAG: diguanylate cyclase [Bacillota bacterium]|nr:diguanylate cyclase [Bacillota bacterium]
MAAGRYLTFLKKNLLEEALRVIAEVNPEVAWARVVIDGTMVEIKGRSQKGHDNRLEWDIPVGDAVTARVQLGLAGSSDLALPDTGPVLPAVLKTIFRVADAAEEACLTTVTQLAEELQIRRRELETLQRQMKYLSFRDPLTGLYNRRFFREEVKRLDGCAQALPVSVIVARLKGLRQLGITKGDAAADEVLRTVARAIESLFQPGDVVARVGDDQFAVVLRQTGVEAARSRAGEIELAVQLIRAGAAPDEPLAMFTGVSFADRCDVPMASVLLAANNDLYRTEKSCRSGVARSVISMLKVLVAERDDITGAHSDRLLGMAERFASAVNLSAVDSERLRILAVVHDIGKISVPDRILFKEGPLTPAERCEMERHSEIGYRIASSVAEMAPLAELIRYHHERWDGKGYPDGLAGLAIPLPCRMLSIMDAFDAMTNDRPYRRALGVEAALDELRRCAGSQFDPELAEIFVDRVVGGDKAH